MAWEFLDALALVHPKDQAERYLSKVKSPETSNGKGPWIIKNEIRPSDLFCYLGGRFGPPNGIQNFLRNDSSDNFIHWEWVLSSGDCILTIQGMSFRTEVWVSGKSDLVPNKKEEFVEAVKGDFKNHGESMSKIRNYLEHWDEFINPYRRIVMSLDVLVSDLEALQLNPEADEVPGISSGVNKEEWEQRWNEVGQRYSRGVGLCFGIRAMLPVRIESFINLLMFLLLRADIKQDQRLSDSIFRQHIDVRVKSLHINCVGFAKPVDYTELADFHSLMNGRNDLLHGNVSINDLVFGDVRFLGKIPVFERYLSFWERAFGILLKGVGLSEWRRELEIVESAEEYLLSLLNDEIAEKVKFTLNSRELGIERSDKRLGVLFPEWIVDFAFGSSSEPSEVGD